MLQRSAAILLISLFAVQCSSTAAAEPGLRERNVLANRPNSFSATHQRRELGFSWWWTLLNHIGIHPPCPPHGPKHRYCHKSSGGSSSGGSSGNGSSSGSSSYSGSTSSSYYSDNGEDGASESSSWYNDGYSDGEDGGYSDSEGDENAYFTAEDEYGSTSNYLENGDPSAGGAATVGLNAQNVVPFVIAAVVAALVGVAFMVVRRRQQQGSSMKSKAYENDESGVATGFVEISNIRTV